MGRFWFGFLVFNGGLLILRLILGLGLGWVCLCCLLLELLLSFLKAEGQTHGEPEREEDEGQGELNSADSIDNFLLIAVEEGEVGLLLSQVMFDQDELKHEEADKVGDIPGC